MNGAGFLLLSQSQLVEKKPAMSSHAAHLTGLEGAPVDFRGLGGSGRLSRPSSLSQSLSICLTSSRMCLTISVWFGFIGLPWLKLSYSLLS